MQFKHIFPIAVVGLLLIAVQFMGPTQPQAASSFEVVTNNTGPGYVPNTTNTGLTEDQVRTIVGEELNNRGFTSGQRVVHQTTSVGNGSTGVNSNVYIPTQAYGSAPRTVVSSPVVSRQVTRQTVRTGLFGRRQQIVAAPQSGVCTVVNGQIVCQ